MRSARIRRGPGVTTLLVLAALAAPPGRAAEADRLAWLAGSWSGTKEGVASEEHWTSPAGGTLLGMHKDVSGQQLVAFEFLRIAPDGEGRLCYLASPRGAPPIPFCASEVGDRRVVFENRAHDFPQRILYWLDGEGRLHARVEGPLDGREAAEEWVWTRSVR
jgi:hypothetical protein